MVGAFGAMFAIEKNKESAAGVPLFLAFKFFVGLTLACRSAPSGPANRRQSRDDGVGETGAVFLGMAVLSSTIQYDPLMVAGNGTSSCSRACR